MSVPSPDLSESPDAWIDPEILASLKTLPTEDDLPYDDGEPMESPRHRDQMILLIESLKIAWADRRGYYVSGNMFVYYAPYNTKKFVGPDFFVVLDVEDRERKSWTPWFENMRFPDLIIELLSDSTRARDKNEKKTLYARHLRTAEYYLYDPFSQEFAGYRLQGLEYTEVTPDAERTIYSHVTGLYLGVRAQRLRWITTDGAIVPTPQELAQQEHLRAEQEHLRAEQEHLRAEQERQRAERAEQLLEEYRHRFGPLA